MAPLSVSLLFLLCIGVRGVSILNKFRMTFIQPMEPPFTSWTYSWGSLLIRSSIIFSGCVDMLHCFFIWLGFPQLKHLVLAAFCTLKVSNVTNFVLWDIDPISLYAFKYSIREPVSSLTLLVGMQTS